jgi:competence protein ComEA
MPTSNERRALWFLAAVALSGSVVRIVRSRAPEPATDPALQRQIGRVDSALDRRARSGRSAGDARRGSSKAPNPAPGTQHPVLLDLNQADAAALEALPGVGPALAARIIAARDSLHGFRALDGLCALRGVGPALIKRLRPLVTVSGDLPVAPTPCPESPRAQRKSHSMRRPKPR